MTQLEFTYQVNCAVPPLKTVAKYLTRNEEDSKDLLQDTLLKAYLYRDSFISGSSMKAWLSTIMRNVYLNDRKRSQKIQKVPLEVSEFASNRTVSAHDEYAAIYYQDIAREVNKLNETVRIPFEMARKGYKNEEIADSLNLSLPAVKSRIFSARKQLQKNLADQELIKKYN